MAEMTHDEQDELAKAAYEPDSSCAHNMVPLIRAVEEIVEARIRETLERAAEVVEENGSDNWWWTLAEEIRALGKRECSPPTKEEHMRHSFLREGLGHSMLTMKMVRPGVLSGLMFSRQPIREGHEIEYRTGYGRAIAKVDEVRWIGDPDDMYDVIATVVERITEQEG